MFRHDVTEVQATREELADDAQDASARPLVASARSGGNRANNRKQTGAQGSFCNS
jgi:hypothetical protein